MAGATDGATEEAADRDAMRFCHARLASARVLAVLLAERLQRRAPSRVAVDISGDTAAAPPQPLPLAAHAARAVFEGLSDRLAAQARGEAATDTGDDDAVSRDAPEGIEAAVLEEITLGVLAPAEPP